MSSAKADTDALRYEDECEWCEQTATIKDHEVYESRLISGPERVFRLEYGRVCVGCWDDIIQQWQSSGELHKPMSSFAPHRSDKTQ